jgi:hypothetical protein
LATEARKSSAFAVIRTPPDSMLNERLLTREAWDRSRPHAVIQVDATATAVLQAF